MRNDDTKETSVKIITLLIFLKTKILAIFVDYS